MKKVISVLLLGLATMFILPAQATPVPSYTIYLNTVYTGYTPDGSSPWLTATYTPTSSTTGTLDLTSNLTQGDFVQGSNGVTGWAFYLDGTVTGVSCDSGTCPKNTYTTSSDINSGPVPGSYNLGFSWFGSQGWNIFAAGDTASFTLTFDSAISGNPFALNSASFYSYSHVQGISGNPTCSGYIVAGPGQTSTQLGSCSATNVPEPAALGMFGFGALLIGVFVSLRRRLN